MATGFALAAGVLIAGPVSGGAANPARSLGPMIVAGTFPSFWLYIVGPVVGGDIGALAYHRGIGHAVAPESAVADTSTDAAASSSERRPSDG